MKKQKLGYVLTGVGLLLGLSSLLTAPLAALGGAAALLFGLVGLHMLGKF